MVDFAKKGVWSTVNLARKKRPQRRFWRNGGEESTLRKPYKEGIEEERPGKIISSDNKKKNIYKGK